MTRSNNQRAPFYRLASHFLRRLLHGQAAEAIIAAIESEIITLGAFLNDGIVGGVFHPGPSATGKSDAEIKRAIVRAENNQRQTGSFVVEDGEIVLTNKDTFSLIKHSGGTSGLIRSTKTGHFQTLPNDRPRDGSTARLLKSIRECASPPDPTNYVVLLLVADALARTGLDLAEVLKILRRPRTIVSVFCSLAGFEPRFLDLLDSGYLLPGATLRSDGYTPWASADLKSNNLNQEGKRRVVCFSGATYDEDLLDRWTLQAASRTRPILCIAASPSSVPPKLVVASDLILICGPLTAEIVAHAIRSLLGDVEPAALNNVDCSQLKLSDVALALGPKKTPSEAISLLVKLAGRPNACNQRIPCGQLVFFHPPRRLKRSDEADQR